MSVNIQQKLLLISLIPLFVLTGILFWAHQISKNTGSLVQEAQQRVRNALLVKDLDKEVIQIQQWLSDISATRGLDGLDDGFLKAKENYAQFQADAAKFERYYLRRGESNKIVKLNVLKKAVGGYYQTGVLMAKAYVEGGPGQGNKTMEAFDVASTRVQQSLAPFLASQVKEAKDSTTQVFNKIHRFSNNLTWILMLASLAIFLISFMMGRGIIGSITALSQKMLEMVQGEADLHQRIPSNRNDEIGVMTELFNQFLGKLQKTVDKIVNLTSYTTGLIQSVSQGIEKIDESGSSLAVSASVVKRHAEQVTAQIQGLDSSVGQAKVNVQHIEQLSKDLNLAMGTVAAGAEQAGSNMASVAANSANIAQQLESGVVGPVSSFVKAMQGISQKTSKASNIAQGVLVGVEETNRSMGLLVDLSSKIDRVIQAIDNISNQTNLLSLNATIEAAGAGPAGKGFAVVASEVKGLSFKTRKANGEIGQQMGEIKQLIRVCQNRNMEVSKQVVEMSQISTDIAQVVATQTEQATQINQAVDQIGREVWESVIAVQEANAGIGEITQLTVTSSEATKKTIEKILHSAQLIQLIEQASQKVGLSMGEIKKSVAQVDQLIVDNHELTQGELSQTLRLQDFSGQLGATIGSFSNSTEFLIGWEDSLLTGNRELDQEHESLVSSINQFYVCCQDGESSQKQAQKFELLLENAKQHFQTEEKLFSSMNPKKRALHEAGHQKILARLTTIQEAYHQGVTVDLKGVFETIQKWIMHDLLVLDHELAAT